LFVGVLHAGLSRRVFFGSDRVAQSCMLRRTMSFVSWA
jgi:hypothetical protein